jgi:hypothetical protein
MPINRLLHELEAPFDADTMKVMVEVHEKACRVLGLLDRSDPLPELLAKKIIEVAQAGEKDALTMYRTALCRSAAPRGHAVWPAAKEQDRSRIGRSGR